MDNENRPRGVLKLAMPSNLPEQTYWDTQQQHKAAWMKFIDHRRGPAMAVTISWNQRRSVERCTADIGRFVGMADEKMLGSRYHRYPSEKRLEALFVFEGVGTDNVHAHSIWWPPQGSWFKYLKLFPRKRSGLWDCVVPRGSYDVKLLNSSGSNDEFTGYILKGQGKNSEADRMVWASQFHPIR